MSFLTPLMLFGAIAAAIPVIIHLFFRSRYRTVPWAAMKFLLTAVEQTSRRLRFQELLLLCLRMLLLVMLALAFARPISTIVRGTGRGDSVDAVFVIDTSFSMGANDGAKTRLERAQAEAIKIIDELPPHSTVQIVTCAGKTKAVIGPRAPANLDQAKALINSLELTHLGTDLSVGVEEAKDVLTRGQASNKELYVFSDMQSSGFEPQAGKLKTTLTEIKEKAIVHFVRCGTRSIKNVAIVGITPQTGIPRPRERVGFAVLVKNTSSESIENLTVSLMVDGDEKNVESEKIPLIKGSDTYTATISAKLGKPGPRVLTAKVTHDELDGDNRFDQVIMVRDRINILVVDGNPNDEKPSQASSFYLMHALAPVKEADRARFHYNPQVVPARLASARLLDNQDICILVNCDFQRPFDMQKKVLPLPGPNALTQDFMGALVKFVRKDGHGAIIFAGPNMEGKGGVDNYSLNQLLPTPIKPNNSVIKADKKPFTVDRQSVASGPPAFWIFKDDEKYFADLDKVEIWKHFEVLESTAKVMQENKMGEELIKAAKEHDLKNGLQIILRASNGQPIVVTKKQDAGEVIFVGTSPHDEGLDPKTSNPNWTDLGTSPEFIPFMHVSVNYLMHSQTQTYNLVAGKTLQWYPQEKQELAYYLVHPDLKTVSRLGLPTRDGTRAVVTASNLPRAGVYYMKGLPRDSESPESSIDVREAAKTGTPIAVIPDLSESADLTAKTNGEIDAFLGFEPIHLTAGEATASTGADRLNREWTVWVLLAVMALVLFEVVLAWWCGRGW